jgi:hypothetical protein
MCGLLHDIGKLLILKLARDFIEFGVTTPGVCRICILNSAF